MNVKKVNLELNRINLIGLDFISENEYLGLTKINEIITPFGSFEIDRNFNFPIIRILDTEHFLIINHTQEKENCFIYNYNGKLMNKFSI